MSIVELISILVAVFGVTAVAISKSGFGGGLGIVITPCLAIAFGPVRALAIALPLLVVMDAFSISLWWRTKFDQLRFAAIISGGLVGVSLGSLSFIYWNPNTVSIALGLICVFYGSYEIYRRFLAHKNSSDKKYHPKDKNIFDMVLVLIAGTIGGLTSVIAHAGSPPILLYLLTRNMPKDQFVLTCLLFFTIVNIVKIIPFIALNVFTMESLMISAMFLPCVPIGIWLGYIMHGRISENPFFITCFALVVVTGIILLARGYGWI